MLLEEAGGATPAKKQPKQAAPAPARTMLPPLERDNFVAAELAAMAPKPTTTTTTATSEQQALTNAYLNPGQRPGGGNDEVSAYKALQATEQVASQQAEAEAKAEPKFERAQRARAIGADIQGPTNPRHPQGVGVGDVEPMTWEKYNALSPEQRAAVDFNTMLVRAVRKDTSHQDTYDPSKQEKAQYQADVDKMFGDGLGSDLYAPETMAVLRQISFSDKYADLDDFLKLNAAITAKDLKGIGTPPAEGVLSPGSGFNDALNNGGYERADLVQALANQTAAMQEALVKGHAMLQSVNATAKEDRYQDVRLMGGNAQHAKAGLGYQPPVYDASGVPQDLNTYFQDAFEKLANRANNKDSQDILGAVRQALHPDELQAFMSYVDSRTSNAERFGQPLGEADGVKYRTPEQFRQLLGLEK